ncbi:hypothetical protein [Phaffia rhodozyma]|uniref:Uncharacterized protein n=1 Tax=Phaffia rhodozyma TaxID=264483 RepID=A0A0F7SJS7_PHARH|nr:hypothetical protein [Phaffia rhodozyma]
MFRLTKALNIPARSVASVRPISYSSIRLASGGTQHGNDPDVLAKEKARNLKGQQSSSAPFDDSHAPGWNENLASDGEANIMADKSKDISVEQLQKKTADQIERHHHSEEGALGNQAVPSSPNPTGSEAAVHADRGEHTVHKK